MKVDGRCHCGQVTYEAEVDPERVLICHCTDCQSLSGSAFRTVAFTREGTFRLLTGNLKVYVKTGESGNKRTQSFCPECGSPIYSGPVDQLVPKDQYWFRSAQAWLGRLGGIDRRETQPVFDAKGGTSR
jgi:hypothetical protein